ncbi:BQ5605_C067g12827 [Microbotryum silenes-dioicae]|uniref:BQ5605_C042g12055 protein n=1 Tax=Microbotryum silenes-dioicae TaxID=796604 RepID=A0A2X0ND36_9BASI|nr:BQ5605_C101g13138 [Microbotryum silenes-dioicae]SGZ29435.1 BQ5605_C057g12691 [Microbotryum silenes-dioicae]SGZ30326.1 BQ5605_C118g13268 [Microbotryum silenes-dioicae]SGZ30360.1 BQ5605_C119g13277 [Microbotryum silenes-dioicae]SGZ31962.1 BQ5605_C042g12055 [Microbotryum silenes-dioicae]
MSSSSRSSDSGHSSQGSEASSSFDCRTRRRRPHGAATSASGAGVEPIERPISALSALSSRTAVPSSRQQLSDALARLHLDLDAAPLLRAAAESLTHREHPPEAKSRAGVESVSSAHIWTLKSSEVNSSYADSYTADLLSNPDRFFTSTSSEKVIFYQSFILQWQLKPVHSLPNTITSCKKVLRTVNVNIAELLSVMRSGGSLTNVPMYRNKTLLRASITNGKWAPLKTAKREMLQPFLVQVNFA